MSTENEIEASETLFSVLKRGTRNPEGPYSAEDLLRLLNENAISKEDWVFYEGIDQWKPISEVFEVHEQISHFVDDGQDTHKVAIAFNEVTQVIGDTESIYYIAVQAKVGLLSKTKQCVILTDRHLYLMNERRQSFELEAHAWKTVTNTLMRDEGKDLGTFSILLGAERRIDIHHLPLKQVHRLFRLSQEIKDSASPG